jgi:hypothetical protein
MPPTLVDWAVPKKVDDVRQLPHRFLEDPLPFRGSCQFGLAHDTAR